MMKAYFLLFSVSLGAILLGINWYVGFKHISWESLGETWFLWTMILIAGSILGGSAVAFFWGHLRDEKGLAAELEARVKDHVQSLKEKEDTLNWRDEEARKKINKLDSELAKLSEVAEKKERKRAKEHKSALKKLADKEALADQKSIDTQEENGYTPTKVPKDPQDFATSKP